MGKRLTKNEFIGRCVEIHGDKFNYDKIEYKGCRTKVIIVCKKHGEISILPDNHLYQKQGCSKCAQDDHRLIQISTERLENIKLLHNNNYSYNDLSISNGKIKIICPTHGEFIQTIYNHENGHGCYDCEKESRRKIRPIVTKICKSCEIDKPKSDFLPKYRTCKSCCNA